uniref:EPS8 signaling adaptor L3a n=1 Tax=Oryzias sinensis TaxID=183150 RepID=A0A8C7YVC7_9TELE
MDETSSEISNLSRPSAKSIYLQRRHYAAAVTKMMEKNQYRVEHLFTCDLDGKDLSNVRDCVERLKLLDQMGRVWGQNMMLEVQGANLLLSDIETKEELESISLSHILELNAVLNTEGFSSLLIMSVQLHRKPTTIFMFQCEEIRKERTFLCENQIGSVSLQDILNHILNDVEVFIGRIAAAGAKNLKKNKKKKKGNSSASIISVKGMPSAEEFAACLRKIKYGFNLLGELNGLIKDPSAADFVHSLFSTLKFTIIAPLLTPQCIRFMSEEATPEEDQLWQSLGDPWNIPSTQWPEDDEDIPTYTLEFYDGWQPPEVTAASEPESRQESPEPSPSLKPSHQTSSKNEQVALHLWAPATCTETDNSSAPCSTVRCLGVLSGSMLLGMSREELKTVCQEEGGRVFFQLQAVRSALAVMSEMELSDFVFGLIGSMVLQ